MKDKQKIYKVSLSDNSKRMLIEHILFLSEISTDAAQRLRDKLYRSCESLCIMPHRCPKFISHKTEESYRRLIVGRHQIIFSINEEECAVNIQYILDSRQNNDI